MDPPPPLSQPPFFPLPTATVTSTIAGVIPSAVQPQILPTGVAAGGGGAPPAPLPVAPPPPPSLTSGLSAEAAAHNHVAHAANATAPAAAQTFNHPPYADMIYAAITALKERDGSSKRAIAKYIERVYTGLPPTHSALLAHHLKRLKNTGLLVMVKKSYKLPRSDSSNDLLVANNNNNTTTVANAPPPLSSLPNPNPNPNPAVAVASSPGGPKRGRGRPPKPKSHQPINAAPVMVPVGLSISSQPILSAPITAASAGKRRPGRPKKVAGGGGVVGGAVPAAATAAAVVAGKRRGRPPKGGALGAKKSVGRPKKLKSVASNGVKKVGPKRLPKSVVVPYATGAAVPVTPKPRGRPRKGAAVAPGGAAAAPVAAVAPAGVQGKRPGRPPKVVGGVVKPPKARKRAGDRPVGRPKKNANVSTQMQVEAYGHLKAKFEFFQSKVRQAVGVLRPQLTNETPVSIVATIQDLEGLASMDINTPLREEAQPSAPAQQPPIIQH